MNAKQAYTEIPLTIKREELQQMYRDIADLCAARALDIETRHQRNLSKIKIAAEKAQGRSDLEKAFRHLTDGHTEVVETLRNKAKVHNLIADRLASQEEFTLGVGSVANLLRHDIVDYLVPESSKHEMLRQEHILRNQDMTRRAARAHPGFAQRVAGRRPGPMSFDDDDLGDVFYDPEQGAALGHGGAAGQSPYDQIDAILNEA
jgi:hypothetical protein